MHSISQAARSCPLLVARSRVVPEMFCLSTLPCIRTAPLRMLLSSPCPSTRKDNTSARQRRRCRTCNKTDEFLISRTCLRINSHQAHTRSTPSGRPFHAHFVDVGHDAGLHAPVIYGGVEQKKYLVESTGCGCAFIDYDNDGWMDIFILSGTRLEGAPEGATNRLYKNNRDGTFTDVTKKAGLHPVGCGCGVRVGDYNNDGFDDIFCT